MTDHAVSTRTLASRRLTRLAVAVTALSVGTLGLLVPGATAIPTSAAAPVGSAAPSTSPDNPVRVRVASFNVLGWTHTSPSGTRKKYASGEQRMVWTSQIIKNYRLEVIGLQEFQYQQYAKFKQIFGSSYGVYPGTSLGRAASQNSIAWDASKWQAVEQRTINIPYFRGAPTKMPYVRLQHRATGRQMWFYNSHNPANSAGDAQRFRDEGFRIEMKLVRDLQARTPGVPVFSTGDKNDRERYFCPVVKGSPLRSAGGGGMVGTTCQMPKPRLIDWVMGTSDVPFTGYQVLRTPLVEKASDHPVVMADATLVAPPIRAQRVNHVVVVNVEGLRSYDLRYAPHLRALRTQGASTANARPTLTGSTIPNQYSLLSGRPVRPSQVKSNFNSSVFNVVHDAGRSTALFTSNTGLASGATTSWVKRSWPLERVVVDNGTRKVSTLQRTATDSAATRAVLTHLKSRNTGLAYASLSAARKAAERSGYSSSRYRTTVRSVDSSIGALLRGIRSTPSLARDTTVILTSDGGAASATSRGVARYQVPMIVWGPGVRARSDLYALNPQLRNPGNAVASSLTGPQPLRSAHVANLVTKLLGLAPVHGATVDAAQAVTVRR